MKLFYLVYRVGRLVWRVDRLGVLFEIFFAFPRFRRVVPPVSFDPD